MGVFGIREGHARHNLDEVFHFILLLSNGFSFLQSLQSSPSILGRQERTDWIRPRVKARRGNIIFLLDTKEIQVFGIKVISMKELFSSFGDFRVRERASDIQVRVEKQEMGVDQVTEGRG